MLKFFIPGLVVGVVIGSMLGLYVGTRSGSATLPDIKSTGSVRTEAPTHDDEPPTAPAESTSEPAPATETTKSTEILPESPKP